MVVGRWGFSTGLDSTETPGCLKRNSRRSLEGLEILRSGGCEGFGMEGGGGGSG